MRLAQPRDAHRPKIILEEAARRVFVGRPHRGRAAADFRERIVNRPLVPRLPDVAKWPTAGLVRRESGEVIVGCPAGDIGPFDRLELGISELERLVARLGTKRSGERKRGCDASEEDAQAEPHRVPVPVTARLR